MLNTTRFVRRIQSVLAALTGHDDYPAGRSASSETNGLRSRIDILRAQYQSAVAAGDSDALTALLAEGAVMVPPGGADWDAMFAAASGAPFPRDAEIDIRPLEVVALSKEWAYEFGTAITYYTPRGAEESRQLRDTYLILFRNKGNGWKVYREVASSSPPPNGWPS